MKQFVYCYNNTFLAAPMAYILQQNSIVDTEFCCKNTEDPVPDPDPYDLIGTASRVEPFVHKFIRIMEPVDDPESLSKLNALLSTITFDVGVLGFSYGMWNIKEKWEQKDINLISCQLADSEDEARLFFNVYGRRKLVSWDHIEKSIEIHCHDHHYHDNEYKKTLFKDNIDFAEKLYLKNELLYKWQLDTLFHSSYKEIFTLDREDEIIEYNRDVITRNHNLNAFRQIQKCYHIPNMLTMDLEKICDYLGWKAEAGMYDELEYFKKYIEDNINDNNPRDISARDYRIESVALPIDDWNSNLAICGDSWSSSYSTNVVYQEENSDVKEFELWVNRFVGYNKKENFSRGGSTNEDIYYQVSRAISEGYNYILIFLTHGARFNAHWDNNKSIIPWHDKQPKLTEKYVKSYFSVDRQFFYSYLLVRAMIAELEEANCDFKIFIGRNIDDKYPTPEGKGNDEGSSIPMEGHIIKHPNIVRWHMRDVPFIPPDIKGEAMRGQRADQFLIEYKAKWEALMYSNTSANHLTKKGQLEVIKKLNEVL